MKLRIQADSIDGYFRTGYPEGQNRNEVPDGDIYFRRAGSPDCLGLFFADMRKRTITETGVAEQMKVAREIVHRCNVHDDLVAALELAIGAMYIDGRRGQRTYESVRATLKKAKGA